MVWKKDVAMYGAGKLAARLFPLLSERYDIKFVFDKGMGDSGKRLCGVEIVKPSIHNVNTLPVIIAVADVNSCVATLKELNCIQKIFFCTPYLNGAVIFECNDHMTLKEILKTSQILMPEELPRIIFRQNTMRYIPEKRRYFILCGCDEQTFFADTGGPVAGLRFLWDANNRLELIDNLYTVMPGLVYMPQGAVAKVPVEINPKKISVSPVVEEAHAIPVNYNEIMFYRNLDRMKTALEYIGDALNFSCDDVFLFLDSEIAQAYINAFPDYPNVVLAYHAQGTLSNQLRKSKPDLCEAYDLMQSEELRCIKDWIFPTHGAASGFLQSANEEMCDLASRCRFHVLYSSYEPKEKLLPDDTFIGEIEALHDYDIMFASATFLYKNKGVERIPRILSLFKKQTGLRIKWILIGMGEMEDEVRKNIETYLEPTDYVWYNRRFDNQDNVFALFTYADFYIMMHYISVSDLSTMQAMAYGCVPLLSNVGGNFEFCGFDNGILVDPQTESLNLGKYFTNGQLDRKYLGEQKQRNQNIIRERFNEKQFLSGYRDFLYAFRTGERRG